MKTFDQLKTICETLLGPGGCPWDQKQTFQSLRTHFLEEAHELLEAIDEDDTENMVEELGDVFFQLIFLAKLGEISKRFTLDQVLETVSEKLIRRHPHVYGDRTYKSEKDHLQQWDEIKKLEKKKRKHALEGIPKSLGALARAQKVVETFFRKEVSFPLPIDQKTKEEAIGDQMIDLIIQAAKEEVDAESAVRTALKKFEKAFAQNDQKNV